MTEVVRRDAVMMDTRVSITVIVDGTTPDPEPSIGRAFAWFGEVEARCSRFDARSEVMQLTARAGTAVAVSRLLYEVVRFALEVAAASDGAFDPTVGHILEARGFNRDYRTGRTIATTIDPSVRCTFRDVRLDHARRTITLRRPLILDLGGVAKGFAIDLAAHELESFRSYAIDAGGDLLVRGVNEAGGPWRVGVRHPREPTRLLEVLGVSDRAVCTSAGYERVSEAGEGHLVDPRTGKSVCSASSVTVIGPTAMLADALATAAFVLGPSRGVAFLERQGVDGLIVPPSLEQRQTSGFARYRQ